MNQKSGRNSSIELLRIFSILGIICMHSLALVYTNSNFLILSVVENSLFNIGVSCFVLISGYFGIHLTVQKWLNLEMVALFGGLLTLIEIVRGGGDT